MMMQANMMITLGPQHLAANDNRTPAEEAAGQATASQCEECPTRHCEQCVEEENAARIKDFH